MAWRAPAKRKSWRQRLHNFLSLPVDCGISGSTWRFVLFSVAVHVALFAAIFDIYFTSPVVSGIAKRHQAPLPQPPAARLVLIVSDGLRAHSLFDGGMAKTPFLRDKVLRSGAWGVSHTRVPTESRPGHVALIAGIYEDVASVARGWQENAVEFDSVFNRSTATWAWGSPDIVPMFARGAVPGRVHIDSYEAAMEDFARDDSGVLDRWVVRKATEFLRNATERDWAQAARLKTGQGFVFFLHLLGADTSGHSHKPRSDRFGLTLAAVDDAVRALETAFEAFFEKDGRTAYVFTSDHGMTDWGSHGAGHDHETLTPLIAWGAGIRGPQPRPPQDDANFATDWPIPRRRFDVDQADVCPLMAALLGLEFPANSVGRLPLDFLNVSDAAAALLTRANAMQMLEQFKLKRSRVKEASLAAFFTESPALSPSKIEERLRQAAHAEIAGTITRIIEIFEQLAKESLEGLYYFHRYDRFFSGLCISAIFVLWILALLLSISPRLGYSFAPDLSRVEVAIFSALALSQVAVLAVEARPALQWLYRLGPLYLLWCLYRQRHLVSAAQLSFRGFLDALVVLWGLELLVWSFFWRFLLSIAVLLNSVWVVALHVNSRPQWQPSLSLSVFVIASGALAIFPMFPVIGGEVQPWVVLVGPLVSACILAYVINRPTFRLKAPFAAFVILAVQVVLLLVACLNHALVHVYIRKFGSLPVILQVSSWLLTAISAVLVLVARQVVGLCDVTLLSVTAAISTIYCLLSIYYETVFLFALAASIQSWVTLEREQLSKRVAGKPGQHSHLLRHCYTYTLYMLLSFFGTGNIASINSFDPQSVYCFLTVFHPFLMGALMLLKIVLPMLLTTCAFSVLVSDVQITLLSRVTMVLADFMALHFFFLIRDWGSWLEIGTSISHYVISMAFTVVVALFIAMARFLLPVGRGVTISKES